MRLLVLVCLAAMLGGCATSFNATAPAGAPGRVYVAGSKGGQRAIWLCPTEGNDTKCSEVEIQD